PHLAPEPVLQAAPARSPPYRRTIGPPPPAPPPPTPRRSPRTPPPRPPRPPPPPRPRRPLQRRCPPSAAAWASVGSRSPPARRHLLPSATRRWVRRAASRSQSPRSRKPIRRLLRQRGRSPFTESARAIPC